MTHLVTMHDIENNVHVMHRAVVLKVIERTLNGSPLLVKVMPDICEKGDVLPTDAFILGFIPEEHFKDT